MIVFDAEPLIAYYWDESGSDNVESRIRDVETGEHTGLINTVTCTEVHYVVRRDDEQRADRYLTRIQNWFRVIDARSDWESASLFKNRYGVALGDAFTLAAAHDRDGIAFVGADDDFDDITEVDIERFRSETA